jgi:holo-[acyl-carrier protein] synthase
MIQGIGVDIVEVERIQRSISRFGDRLRIKLFTHNEIRYCYSQVNPAMYFASFFAAKEALSKALATGNTGIFNWKDVEVNFLSDGRPALQFYNLIAERLKSYNTHLSLSMSAMSVTAFVVIQSH